MRTPEGHDEGPAKAGEAFEEHLARLRERTGALEPALGFEARVMAAIEAPARSSWAPAFALIDELAVPLTAVALVGAVALGVDGALGWHDLWDNLAQAMVETLS